METSIVVGKNIPSARPDRRFLSPYSSLQKRTIENLINVRYGTEALTVVEFYVCSIAVDQLSLPHVWTVC